MEQVAFRRHIPVLTNALEGNRVFITAQRYFTDIICSQELIHLAATGWGVREGFNYSDQIDCSDPPRSIVDVDEKFKSTCHPTTARNASNHGRALASPATMRIPLSQIRAHPRAHEPEANQSMNNILSDIFFPRYVQLVFPGKPSCQPYPVQQTNFGRTRQHKTDRSVLARARRAATGVVPHI